jgi:hypothetical protein
MLQIQPSGAPAGYCFSNLAAKYKLPTSLGYPRFKYQQARRQGNFSSIWVPTGMQAGFRER